MFHIKSNCVCVLFFFFLTLSLPLAVLMGYTSSKKLGPFSERLKSIKNAKLVSWSWSHNRNHLLVSGGITMHVSVVPSEINRLKSIYPRYINYFLTQFDYSIVTIDYPHYGFKRKKLYDPPE